MKNYRIKVAKEELGDSGFLELRALLELIVTKEDADTFVKKDSLSAIEQELSALIGRELNKAIRLQEGLLNINAPVSVRSTPDIEKIRCEEGMMYYDIVNHRWRRSTLKGWENA